MLKNLVYFGSPEFSAQILESVLKSDLVNVVGVITTPDKPLGRKQVLTASPVAHLASEYNLPVYKPVKMDDANLAHIKLLKPDIFLVVSFGKIIPQIWLDAPNITTLNIHFSLLPKYRGALCISEAIKNQDSETGVTLMEMDAKLDHGDIIAQTKVSIDTDDDVATLTTKLTQAAGTLLEQRLPEICAQNYTKTPQDESLVIFTPSHRTLTHTSAFIPSVKIINAINGTDSKAIHALIRSLNPEPGVWTTIDETDLKVIKTSLSDDKLVIDLVQASGKNPISWKQFLSGHPLK
jgi:methionyl-tRNA formyltransferase